MEQIKCWIPKLDQIVQLT